MVARSRILEESIFDFSTIKLIYYSADTTAVNDVFNVFAPTEAVPELYWGDRLEWKAFLVPQRLGKVMDEDPEKDFLSGCKAQHF